MLKYVGRGNWLPGIPARDLSDEEVEKHGGAKFLIGTGLYEASKKDASPLKSRSIKKKDEKKEVKDARN